MPNIVAVTDLNAPELDVFSRLTEAQLRNRRQPELGLFIAESPKVISCALNAGCEPVSLLMESRHIDGDAREIIARCGEIPIYTGERDLLAELTGFHLTRGVLCAMRRPALGNLAEICAGAKRVAVLEGIVDAANLGAIFRSAAALGMDAVLVSPTCIDPLCRRAVRVSMGTVFQVPWTRLGQNWMGALKGLGFRTAAMALHEGAIPIDDPVLAKTEKLAILFGTEGDGLQPRTIAESDYTVIIPMSHGVDSLNVAAASAVAFWAITNHGTSPHGC